MSEQEFESYLRLLCRFLHLSGTQRSTIARELRDHMEERLEELIARGVSREDAIATALDEFGDAAALAGEFGRIGRRRRWIMRTSGGVIGIAAAVLIVSFLLPENRRSVPAPAYSIAADRVSDDPGVVQTASQPAGDHVVRRVNSESKAEAQTKAKLASIISEVVFPEGSTLEDVIEFLRHQSQVSIDVNWNALSLVGVDRTTVLTLNVRNVKVETALSLALANAGAASGVRLGYDVSDGVIRISTQEEVDRDTVTRVYDCKDLVREGLSHAQLKRIQEIFTEELGKTVPQNMMDLMWAELGPRGQDELVDLIKVHVTEGKIGSVSIYDGLLVVTHNSTAHARVAELIEMMREMKVARGAATAPMGMTSLHEQSMQMGGAGFGGRGFGGGKSGGMGAGMMPPMGMRGGAPGLGGGGGGMRSGGHASSTQPAISGP